MDFILFAPDEVVDDSDNVVEVEKKRGFFGLILSSI